MLNHFDQIFHEDHTYEIENFVVKFYETTEIDRCFKDEQHIIMSHLTKVRELNIPHNIIPFDICKFTEINFIYQIRQNINHFIGKSPASLLRIFVTFLRTRNFHISLIHF